MLRDWRREVMDAPPEHRLVVAMQLLEDVCGTDDDVTMLMVAYDLTAMEAQIVHRLAQSVGAPVAYSALCAVLGRDTPIATIRAHIYNIRQKTELPIRTHMGFGLSLEEPPQIPNSVVYAVASRSMVASRKRQRQPWTQDEEDELVRMLNNGSDWASIAHELERSERACIARATDIARRKDCT